MKQIKLTQGLYTLVDDEDYNQLNEYSWSAVYDYRNSSWSVRGYIDRRFITMSRYLLKVHNFKIKVRHKNGNRLDNRKSNLYISNQKEIAASHSLLSNNKTNYRGVTKNKNGKYKSTIVVNGKTIHLGYFKNIEEAAETYNKAAIKYFGEHAYQNQTHNNRKRGG